MAADLSTLVVAVDGPSGSGKSSVSRLVARRFGLRYLDTGSMYRAVALAVLRAGVDPADPAAVAAVGEAIRIEPSTDPDAPGIVVDGEDVSEAIRSDQVTAAVSPVSAVPEVRAGLVALQRSTIGAGGIVVEGRDIGTTVVPGADLKVFLDAHPEARAARRTAELDHDDVDATREALAARDAYDSGRKASPLAQAPDAVVVDATHHGLDEVVAQVSALVEQTLAGASR
jgi:cytidylate kinase